MELSETLRLHSLWMSGESEGVRADLQGANLTCADLEEADLTYANLEGANLTYTNLTGADLTCANLRGTDLTGANLTNANLRGADLRGTDLTNANLTRADLTGVNWGDPSITSAATHYWHSSRRTGVCSIPMQAGDDKMIDWTKPLVADVGVPEPTDIEAIIADVLAAHEAGRDKNERLRELCGEVYQIVGALSTLLPSKEHEPTTRVLDNLLAAASGVRLPHDSLLPYSLPVGTPTPLFDRSLLTSNLSAARPRNMRDKPHLLFRAIRAIPLDATASRLVALEETAKKLIKEWSNFLNSVSADQSRPAEFYLLAPMEWLSDALAGTPPESAPSREFRPKPGWLKRDVDRAAKRMDDWFGTPDHSQPDPGLKTPAMQFKDTTDVVGSVRRALTEPTTSGERARTLEEAAMIVEGWSTAVNYMPFGMTYEHIDFITQRDLAMGKAIRALIKPEEGK